MADDGDRLYDADASDPTGQADLHQVRPGATHAPHHPTKEWVDKISAMHLFDDGYEKVRERIFENQKRLGVIPKDAKMAPWPKEILKPWDQLTWMRRSCLSPGRGLSRPTLPYSDHEIGRVIQSFRIWAGSKTR